jgi:hypothetical protein
MQGKSSAEMAVFPAEAPPCLPSTPSNSTDAAEYQNRTYPLPRGSKRQANSMSFIKLLTPMGICHRAGAQLFEFGQLSVGE